MLYFTDNHIVFQVKKVQFQILVTEHKARDVAWKTLHNKLYSLNKSHRGQFFHAKHWSDI